jgi:hypothetical protein
MVKIKVEYSDVEKLLPYAGNAKVHGEGQIEDLCRSISEFGFVNPVLIDERGEIVGGHGRVLAANRLGLKQVPIVRLSHLSERQIRALRLADNRIALSSTWDLEKLGEELSQLAALDVDLSLTGFDEQEIDSLLKADVSILPDSYRADILATEGGRGEPSKQDGELVPVSRPKTTDNEFSTFELVMNHQNKVRLVEVLSRIREDNGFAKLEDALMELVKIYEEKEK